MRTATGPRRSRWVAAVAGLVAVLAVLVGVLLAPQPVPLAGPERIVVVAAGGLAPRTVEDAVVDRGPAAVGTVGTGYTPPPGGCGARGWAVLSAGVPVDEIGACTVSTDSAGGVTDWRDRVAAAPGLGRLGESGRCVSAVGTAASLGAVRSDGTVAESLPVTDWRSAGYATACPVVLVDGEELFGSDLDSALADLLAQPGTQVWVVSTGPGPLRTGSAPQPAVVLGAGVVDGVLVGPGGRQPSLVDLAQTLHRLAGPTTGGSTAGPGSADQQTSGIAVRPGPVSAEQARTLLQDRVAVSDPSGVWVGLGVAWGLLVLLAVLTGRNVAPRRPLWWQPLHLAALPAAVQLVGLLPWWRLPESVVVLAAVVLVLLIAWLTRRLASRLAAPAWLLAGILSLSVLALSLLGSDVLGPGLLGAPTGPLSPLPGRSGPAALAPTLVPGALWSVGLAVGLVHLRITSRTTGKRGTTDR